jgi:hypothetical protein
MTYKLLTSLQLPDIPDGLESAAESGSLRIFARDGNLIQIDFAGVEKVITPLTEIDPVFTYAVSGDLSRIDYDSGNYKLFFYNSEGLLTQLDYVVDLVIYRKTFTYDSNSNLINITYSQL